MNLLCFLDWEGELGQAALETGRVDLPLLADRTSLWQLRNLRDSSLWPLLAKAAYLPIMDAGILEPAENAAVLDLDEDPSRAPRDWHEIQQVGESRIMIPGESSPRSRIILYVDSRVNDDTVLQPISMKFGRRGKISFSLSASPCRWSSTGQRCVGQCGGSESCERVSFLLSSNVPYPRKKGAQFFAVRCVCS